MTKKRSLKAFLISRLLLDLNRVVFHKRRFAINEIDELIQQNPFWNNDIVQDASINECLTPIWSDARAAMSFHEMVNLYRLAKRTSVLAGDIAEVGVFRGGSAKLLASATANGSKAKKIHLFDTFQGLPEVTAGTDTLTLGDIAHPLEDVKNYLRDFPLIRFYPGMFPDTANELGKTDIQYCMVNLDADTYRTTLMALEFFYPRMVTKGVICIHDYHSVTCPGVKKAVDEFFRDKPEILFELWHTQIACSKS